MPTIICPNCAKSFYLDPFTYTFYSGDVRCTNCGATIAFDIINGQLSGTPKSRALNFVIIPNAPKNVSSDVFEAQICHAVGAYKRARKQ